MSALHPSFVLGGLALGALAAVVGGIRPPARGAALVAAAVFATAALIPTTHARLLVILLPVVGAALGLVLVQGVARWRGRDARAPVAGAWALVAVLLADVWLYLSVADTEGAVLVGALVGATAVPWVVARWRAPVDALAAGTGALAGATVAAAVGARWTPGGWLAVKVGLLALYGMALVVGRRRRGARITNGRAHRSP